MLHSMRPLSEPLHGRINTEDPFTAYAESETTKSLFTCHRSHSPRRPRSSQQGRLSQEDRAYRRQAKPEFDNNTSEEMLPQQQDEEENINSNGNGLQQSDENTARVALITEMGDELHLPAVESSKHTRPLLTEVTFRPYSPDYYSFSALIQDDRDEPEFTFGQFSKLIDCVGHSGNTKDLTIKQLKQHLFLVTGFSRRTSSRPSQSGRTVRSTTNACLVPLSARRTRADKGRSASTFPSQRREASSHIVDYSFGDGSSEDELGRSDKRKYSQWSASSRSDVDGFGDGDPNTCSDGDAYSSEDNVGRSDNRKYSEWSALDKQRLSAYKKEGKSWEWIFGKFPGRTKGAVRTRWSILQPRVK
ncbi:hypothetical protein ACLOAV_007084 [Pseudogymnoascus australis]